MESNCAFMRCEDGTRARQMLLKTQAPDWYILVAAVPGARLCQGGTYLE